MPVKNINNFFQGGYSRNFDVNPFNPFLPKIYSLIERINIENTQQNGGRVLNLKVSPSNYDEMLVEADKRMEKALRNGETFSVPFQISVSIDTSKLPVEILAQIIKTNSRKAQEYGNAHARNSNAVIVMYDTREEYRKKLELKMQSQVDFKEFRCQAKGCNRPNAHRTTIFAVVDKRSGDIKYYGSTCVKRVDGEGIIESLDEYVRKLNMIAKNVEKMYSQAKDGLDIKNILNECLKNYTGESSKYSYNNALKIDPHLLNTTKIKKECLGEMFEKAPQNLAYWKSEGFTMDNQETPLNLKISQLMTNILKKNVQNYVKRLNNNPDEFIQWLNRSRGIGTNRSNAKGLLSNLKDDGLARGMTATQMKKTIYNALNLFVIDSELKDWKDELSKEFIKGLQNPYSNIKVGWIDNETYNLADRYFEKDIDSLRLKIENQKKILKLSEDVLHAPLQYLNQIIPAVSKIYFNKTSKYFGITMPSTPNIRSGIVYENDFELDNQEKSEWEVSEKNVEVTSLNLNPMHDLTSQQSKLKNLEEELSKRQSDNKFTILISKLNQNKGFNIKEKDFEKLELEQKRLNDIEKSLSVKYLFGTGYFNIEITPSKKWIDEMIKEKKRIAEEHENLLVKLSDEEFEKFKKQTTKVYLKRCCENFCKNNVITYDVDSGTSIYGTWYRIDFIIKDNQKRIGLMFVNNLSVAKSKQDNIIKTLSNKFSNIFKDIVNKDMVREALTIANLSVEELLNKNNNERVIQAIMNELNKDCLGKLTFNSR